MTDAPGATGIDPTWSSSDKDFVTASLGRSRLWVTMGHGVLNEIYWPSTGHPRLRDVTFYLVHRSGDGRWIDLKRRREYTLSTPAPTVPLLAVRHTGTEGGERYLLELEYLPDTDRDALLVTWRIEGPWQLVVIAAPHVDASDLSSRAWIDGELYASGTNGFPVLCFAATGGFAQASAGYVGRSDGWQDLARNGRLTWSYSAAGPGNVALSGACRGAEGAIAIAIASGAAGARTLALSTLSDDTRAVRQAFVDDWSGWGRTLTVPDFTLDDAALAEACHEAALVSATILKVHEDRGFPGAAVASLSVPWGSSTNTLGGYHLVWPRDTVLTAFAFLVLGQTDEARRTLAHLIAVQGADGGWPQNYYPSGEPFWTGVQLDEAALPILLAAKLRALGRPELDGAAAMVRRAASFVARTGPYSPQDRWEENPGVNPYTLATAIAALVAAGAWLTADERTEALDLADEWLERLDEWCWVTDSRWTRATGVDGHWIRLRPPPFAPAGTERVALRNRMGETIDAADLVAMEYSWLPRLGLVADDDPRVKATVAVTDRALGVDTPSGRVLHRYVSDGYGETEDGAPFGGAGIGRGWPFLSGERGHLAIGLGENIEPYLLVMIACRSPGGLMPEQVWDSAPIPERGLFPGRPSGSAMPLLWTHAEFIKFLCAHAHGRPVERLDEVAERYASARPARAWRWRDAAPVRRLPRGRALVIEDHRPFTLHHGFGGWQSPADLAAVPGTFGLWRVELPRDALAATQRLVFTRQYENGWEGHDHYVEIA